MLRKPEGVSLGEVLAAQGAVKKLKSQLGEAKKKAEKMKGQVPLDGNWEDKLRQEVDEHGGEGEEGST